MKSNSDVRRLAAIMFTDIVGYTSMMDEDEARTRKILHQQRELVFPIIESYGGNVLKQMGDGLLIMFDSANNAVNCALDIQNLQKDFVLRVGIHIGDVVIENEDVFGSGVNIASRVENLTPPGSICITSDVWRQISNLKGLDVKSLGRKELKGVNEPIEIFEVIPELLSKSRNNENRTFPTLLKSLPTPWKVESNGSATMRTSLIAAGISAAIFLVIALTYFRTPTSDTTSDYAQSVAVLPLENLSPNPDDAFFTDGVHEDIIIQLARIADLKIIARSSVISYKAGESRNFRKIAEELGVNSVLEGSVRRSGERIRVAVSLIDVNSNRTLWADIFERNIEDLFTIQGEIAREISSALQISIRPTAREQIDRRPTNNLEAYELYLRAREYDLRPGFIVENMEIAERLYKQAIEKDSTFALAYAKLSILNGSIYWFQVDYSSERVAKITSNADRALELVPDLPEGLHAHGYYYYWVVKDYSKALEMFQKALNLHPNNSDIIHSIGAVQRRMGDFEESVKTMERAVELNPRNPSYMYQIALSNVYLHNLEQSYSWFERALSIVPDFYIAQAGMYTSELMITGDVEKYQTNLEKLSYLEHTNPDFWWYHNLIGQNIDYLIDLSKRTTIRVFDSQDAYHSIEFVLGLLHKIKGNDAIATGYLNDAATMLEVKVDENPTDFRMHSVLGRVYALQGKRDEAVRLGEKLLELVPENEDALLHARVLLDRALIYCFLEDAEMSVVLLEDLLNRPSNVTVNYLKIFPDFNFIRDTPEFRALIAKYENRRY